MKSKTSQKQAIFYLILNSFFWGICTPIIQIGLQIYSIYQYLFIRYIIVSIIIILLHKFSFKDLKILTKPKALITMLYLTPLTLIIAYWGLVKTSALIASITIATQPIIADILGSLILHEKVTKKEKTGTFIALIGILWFTIQQAGTNNTSSQLLGILLIIASTITWVLGNIQFKEFNHQEKDKITYGSLIISVPIFGLLTLTSKTISPFDALLAANASILYMATFGTIVAFLLYQEALKVIEVSEANLFTYLQPVFGIPAAIIIGKEAFKPIYIVQLGLILLGLIISNTEKFQHKCNKP